MYQITYNGHLLYDPRDKSLVIWDTTVELAVNTAGALSFSIGNDNPLYNELKTMSGTIELLQDGIPVFRGRIVRMGTDMFNIKTVECEGVLACLNDSLIEPFSFPEDYEEDPEYITSTNRVEFFLEKMLEKHNEQVSDSQKLLLGNVTVMDPNNYIKRSSESYNSSWSIISDKLFDSALGGYLLIRYEADGNYIDYYNVLPLTNTQEIVFASNLLDVDRDKDGTKLFTAILPIGADGLTIEDTEDGEITDRITKQGKILFDRVSEDTHGRITICEKWDDVTVPENLLAKAKNRLENEGIILPEIITVTAADIGFTDEEVQSFRVGRNTVIKSLPHGLTAIYPLNSLSIDIQNPADTRICLGGTVKTLATSINTAIKNSATQTVDLAVKEASEIVNTTRTEILQDAQEIILSALSEYVASNDFDTYKQTVSTALSVMAGTIEMNFSTVTQNINNVNGDLQNIYNERLKYIRFENGDIILGEKSNEITLRLSPDRMSFYQGNLEVAYISNNKLYITNSETTVQSRIGKFAFTPAQNGSLTFRKVGS